MDQQHELELELKRLDTLIRDAEGRMPAHSAKPVMMQRIFELEEAREKVARQLNRLQTAQP